jgi:hypothetical protein
MSVESQGTSFTFNNGTSAIAVGGFISYDGFDGESTEIDTTTLASTAKEYIIGLEDYGNFNLSLNHDNADVGQIAMRAAKTSRIVRECVITFSDSSVITFNAYVKSFPLSGGVDDVNKSNVSLRVTGTPVLT